MNALLTLNTGSSSIKFRLFGMQKDLPFLMGGKISDIGSAPVLTMHRGEHSKDETHTLPQGTTHETALDYILTWLSHEERAWTLGAAAHRIVHGGSRCREAVELDRLTLDYLHTLSPLAPLHQPNNLLAIEALWKTHPSLRQYGCFDTAFHADQEPLFTTYALPKDIREKGVRRYGFHGLSYQWIVHCLKKDFPLLAAGRVVAAHLGNGSSLCAIKNGISVDTTMGMTALDGLPMGTRCGSLDAGAVLYMLQFLKLSPETLAHILYEESGLKGLSGISNDVKTLLASESDEAKFALDYYALKTAQQIAALSVSLGGMDALIFTGGIGENAEPVRSRILSYLSSIPTFETYVIPANEERGMALDIMEKFGQEFVK